MAGMSTQPPVFIIGSLRSGASLLSLALGQHSALQPVLENRWLEEVIAGLLRGFNAASESRATSQLEIDGFELESFFAHFGASARDLLAKSLPSHQRPIDATPANVFLAVPLRMLFPDARFIHIVRDAGEVASTLTDPTLRTPYKSRHIQCSVDQAVAHWTAAISAGLAAERALGSGRVLRVARQALIEQSEQTIATALDFLELSPESACLRPFSSVSPETIRVDRVDLTAYDEAMALDRILTGADQPSLKPGDEAHNQVFAELWRRAMRNQPLVPPIPGTMAAVRQERKRRVRPRAAGVPVPESALARFMKQLLEKRPAQTGAGRRTR